MRAQQGDAHACHQRQHQPAAAPRLTSKTQSVMLLLVSGTLTARPFSLPLRSGKMRAMAVALPVEVGARFMRPDLGRGGGGLGWVGGWGEGREEEKGNRHRGGLKKGNRHRGGLKKGNRHRGGLKKGNRH